MVVSKPRELSPGVLYGLYFMQKYRYLTIPQFARITGFSYQYTALVLRDFKRWGFVSHFGYTGIPGQGKTPKVMYLHRKGWELLCTESSFDISPFTEVQKETAWAPHMYHRLRIIDLMISLE